MQQHQQAKKNPACDQQQQETKVASSLILCSESLFMAECDGS